jgi:ethanolamine utilization cobalamin adenosyltransferase
VLSLARKILRFDVLEEPLEPELLCGLTEEELRSHSHFPQEYYGQPHFMPQPSDSMTILRLNRVRCAIRETELAAAAAWPPRDGKSSRPDIQTALNRMSSLVYVLMIREKSKQESGKGCSHGQKNTGCSG